MTTISLGLPEEAFRGALRERLVVFRVFFGLGFHRCYYVVCVDSRRLAILVITGKVTQLPTVVALLVLATTNPLVASNLTLRLSWLVRLQGSHNLLTVLGG